MRPSRPGPRRRGPPLPRHAVGVGDHDHRALRHLAEPHQSVEHDVLVALVELAGGLVGQHERRAARGRRGDRHPLLLAAREGVDAVVGAVAEPEGGQGRVRIAVAPRQAERGGHVLVRAERRPEVAALEDERQVGGAKVRQLGLGQPAQRAPEHAHLAGRRLVEARRQREERALAAARRAEHGDRLAALDAQVEAAQGHRLRRPRAVDLEHVAELERRPFDRRRVALRLDVEALYCHLKLLEISRYASTLSTPLGVASSSVATLPPFEYT